MLGRDKNRVTIKQTTKIKDTVNVPVSQVRQQIRHGTSLLGGPATTQYTNAQQYPTQQMPVQQLTTEQVQGYTGYTPDPYLSNLPIEQQMVNNGSKVESKIKTKIKQKITSKVNPGYESNVIPVQTMTSGLGTSIPIQPTTSGFGTSVPVGTNVMQRKRSSSSSSSSSSQRNRMKGTGANLTSSNVETLIPNQSYPQNTYTTQLPFQQGNIQTGYGTTEVGYKNPNLYASNPIQSSLYRSSNERKGPILGKNLYGQTGFASTGYSIQQPYPGQNVYVEEDPNKISDLTKTKFEKSIM